MKFSTLVLVGLALPSFAAPAFAHIRLEVPKPRVVADNLKSSPCGDAFPDPARVTTFKPGQTITVKWNETIFHKGYFRVILGERGDTDLPRPTRESYDSHEAAYSQPNVDLDKLDKTVTGPVKFYEGNKKTWVLLDYYKQHTSGGGERTTEVKLPDITCDKCTLQLVQGMFGEGRGYDGAYYYGCADIILKGEPVTSMDAGTQPSLDGGVAPQGGNGGQSQTGGRGGQGGNGGEGGGGEDEDDGSQEEDKGSGKSGCSMAGSASPASAALWLLPLAMLFVRRRRR